MTAPVPSTLCEAFQQTAAHRPDAVALRTPGDAVSITWREYADRVRAIAAGLAALGVGPADTVGLMMRNRPEFHLVDTGALHLGAIPFSIYNTSSPEQIAYLFSNAANRVVVCEEQFVPRLRSVADGTAIEHIVCVDGTPEGTIGLTELQGMGDPAFDFEAAWRAVRPEDILTLIYTSGTTGNPKGVELTHHNMLAEIAATGAATDVGPDDRVITYLPSAHVADRWGCHYTQLVKGVQLTCVDDHKAVLAAMIDARPTVFGAVPQLWYKLKGGIEAMLRYEQDEAKKAATQGAFDVGIRYVKAQQAGSVPPELAEAYARADAGVFAPIRAMLGLDQVRISLSGAAPIAPAALEFVTALGLPVCEVWGMSETSAVATINPVDGVRIGTVGIAIPGAELKLAEDGELLVRGDIVMRGYRNDPEKTAEAIDADGWLHTGDVATIDADGYVTIVDRKKELIINAAGKNMSPSNIEGAVKAVCPLVAQTVAIGDNRPYNTALIVLEPDAAAAFAAQQGITDTSPAALATDPAVHAAVEAGVKAANETLSNVEQIKKFTILPTAWDPGGDEITPTMKLRRRPISEKYATEIDALYA